MVCPLVLTVRVSEGGDVGNVLVQFAAQLYDALERYELQSVAKFDALQQFVYELVRGVFFKRVHGGSFM